MILLPGKIYYTSYSNWHHDRRPLTFILYSDMNYTHGINLHYFPPQLLIQFYGFIKKFQKKFPLNWYHGNVVYDIIKKYYPMWVKQAYRTYKTQFLTGFLINDGITFPAPIKTPPSMDPTYKHDMMAQSLNENLKASAVNIIPVAPVNAFAQPQAGVQQAPAPFVAGGVKPQTTAPATAPATGGGGFVAGGTPAGGNK